MDELADVARIVAPVSQQNAALFTGMADTFEALGRDEQALKALIAKAPATLDSGVSSFRVQRPFLTDLTALGEDVAGATEELKGALPPLNDAVRVGTPVQKRLPTLSEETRKTLVHLRELVEAPGTNAALRGLTATVTTLNPQLRFYGPYVTVCNSFNYFFASSPSTSPSPTQRARPSARSLTSRAARRTRSARWAPTSPRTARACWRATHGAPGSAVRRGGGTGRPRRLRGRPARLRRAPGALLPLQVQDRARPALGRPAGADLHRPPARARRPDLHRRARDGRVRRHAGVRAAIRNATVGLIALAAGVVLVYFGWTKELPLRSHYDVKAAFATSNNLRPGSPVRIAGVEVGKVTTVERAGREGAVVTMRIDDEGRPVHSDATAKIRDEIVLEGNFFVDLTAGSPSAPELEDGATLPVQQTATPVQLDEVLTALQSDAREDLKVLLRRSAARACRAPAHAASTARCRTGSPPMATPRSSPRRCSASPATTCPAS